MHGLFHPRNLISKSWKVVGKRSVTPISFIPLVERYETKPYFSLPVFYCWFLTNQQIFGIYITFCYQRYIPKRWTHFCKWLSQAGRGRRMLRKNTLVMPIISLNSFNTKVVFWVVQLEEKLYFAPLCAIWNAWPREYACEIYCNFVIFL